MKKILFSAFVLAGALTMSSCSDGAFGGDFEVDNTELVDMAVPGAAPLKPTMPITPHSIIFTMATQQNSLTLISVIL